MKISIKLECGHIYFFLMLLNSFIYTIYSKHTKHKKGVSSNLFHIYVITFSDLCCIIFYLIRKMKSKKIKTNIGNYKISKNNIKLIYNDKLPINKCQLIKRLIIITLTDILGNFSIFSYYLYIEIYNKEKIYKKLHFILIFNIISKYLFSRLLLKTYFYRHHYLSFAINSICLVSLGILDILSASEEKYYSDNMNVLIYILLNVFRSIIFSFGDVVGKISFNKDYLSPYSLILIKGIIKSIMLLIISFPFFFITINGKNIVKEIGNIFEGSIDIYKYCFIIVNNLFYNILMWIIIDKYSPSHLAMGNVLEVIAPLIYLIFFEINKIDYHFFFEILINIVLIIGTLIHNEIIIIKYCKLDQYTKEKCKLRSNEDLIQCLEDGSDDDSSFDDNENSDN